MHEAAAVLILSVLVSGLALATIKARLTLSSNDIERHEGIIST